ncbi:MAG TPA: Ig-like domain-containing protein [Anaerolineae bacterium]|nr:Ig-like domain-containing protein [Anaerolineae bacterium]
MKQTHLTRFLLFTFSMGLAMLMFGGVLGIMIPSATAHYLSPAANSCFVSVGNSGTTDYQSVDGSALQTAVNNALASTTLLVAGNCTGVQTINGETQTVYINNRDVTIIGGYANGNWGASPDPIANETVLDAGGGGRVFFITNNANVNLAYLTIRNGDAGSDFGGGLVTQSGATVSIEYSRIENNQADIGGGIFNYEPISINNSQLNNNRARAGGAIYNVDTITITNSSLFSNTATTNDGGAVFVNALAIIANSTFSYNQANNGEGGAISSDSTSPAIIEYITLSHNSASNGGGALHGNRNITLANSIIANTINGRDCTDDINNRLVDGGYNLIEDGSCLSASSSQSGDPNLADLADNGGPTLTQAILADSPARNGIPYGVAGCDSMAITDQRGVNRFGDAGCDIGAYEYVNSAPIGVNDAYTLNRDSTFTVPSMGVLANDSDADNDWLYASLITATNQGSLTLKHDGSFIYTTTDYLGSDSFSYMVADGALSPVAHWTFNEGSGNSTLDASGNGLNGILIDNASFRSSTLPSGQMFANASALNLDGNGDRVNIPDSSLINLDAHNQRTVSAWFQADNVNINSRKQVIWEEGGQITGMTIYLYDGSLYGGAWAEPNNWTGSWLSSNQISSGQWHHVALVLDSDSTTGPTANSFFLYLDGVLVDMGSAAQLGSHSGNIGIGDVNQDISFHDTGDYAGSGGHGFAGQIDDLRVMNLAANVNDVNTLMVAWPGLADIATVSLTVTPIVYSLNAVNDMFTTTEDIVLDVPTVGVLANDSSDGGDPLYAALSGGPANGAVMMAMDGAFVYTPTLHFNGVDLFSYTLRGAPPAVAYWPFDEGSGTSTADASNYSLNHPGTLSGASFTTNVPFDITFVNPSALNFDGVDDVMMVSNSTDINTGSHRQRTISLWFRVEDVTINTRKQILWEQGGTGNGINLYVYDGAVYGGAWANTYSWAGSWISSTQISSGQWHHVVLVLDSESTTPTADGIQLYLDGQWQATDAATIIPSHSANIGVGNVRDATVFHNESVSGNGGHGLAGQLDDIRIMNVALTTADIATLRAYPASQTETATVTLNVTSVPDPPTGENDSYQTVINRPMVIASPGVLGNDTEPDGDNMTVVVAEPPVNGDVLLQSDGAFVYTPTLDFVGTDSFTYTVTDDSAAVLSATAAVHITIYPAVIDLSDSCGTGEDVVTAVAEAVAIPLTTTISLAPNCSYTLTAVYATDPDGYGPIGLPIITNTLIISGNGATIIRDETAEPFRFFYVADSGHLILHQTVLDNGYARGGDGAKYTDAGGGGGGAAGMGGAIFNKGELTIDQSSLLNNQARGGDGASSSLGNSGGAGGGGGGMGGDGVGRNGGGLYGGAAAQPTGQAGGEGGGGGGTLYSGQNGGAGGFGGGGGAGGGNSGSATGRRGGDGGFGGGGGGAGDKPTGSVSAIGGSAGFAGGRGGNGGIGNAGSGGGGGGLGGAIFNYGGTVTLQNSSFISNTAQGGVRGSGNGGSLGQGLGYGGALFNYSGTMNLRYSTVATNSATSDGSGIYNYIGATLSLSATIIADSMNTDCVNNGGNINVSNSLIETHTDCGAPLMADPQFGPLGRYGGTPTLFVPFGSPVQDVISLGVDGCGTAVGIDQRGLARPQIGGCDIGAFEVSGLPAVTPTLSISNIANVTARLDWSVAVANCSYDVYRSDTPYGNYTVLTDGLMGDGYDDNGAIGNTAVNYFYYVEAVNCPDSSRATSNRVGEFDVVIVGGS